MHSDPGICLVIPCYNEEQRLPAGSLITSLAADPKLELCLVNDGSTDKTSELIRKMEADNARIHVLELKKNSGKAEAVRQGMNHMVSRTDARFIGYFDADLATPLEEARSMVSRISEDGNVVMLVGSRVKLLGSTQIERLWYRHYFGRVFATVVSNMLGLPVYDTQCGAKVFRKEAVTSLFSDPFISKWLFDVELFYRCLIKYGREEAPNRIREFNISKWTEMGGSKIGPGFVFKVPLELWKIRNAYSSKVG